MTKTDLSYKSAGDLRSAGDPSPAIDDFKNYMADAWFDICYDNFRFQSTLLANKLPRM